LKKTLNKPVKYEAICKMILPFKMSSALLWKECNNILNGARRIKRILSIVGDLTVKSLATPQDTKILEQDVR